MILISNEIGSKEFKPLIPGSELAELEYGDFAFYARDNYVGIERKTVYEMISSAQGNKRLVGRQIPGMKATYDVFYLIMEGIFRSENGILKVLAGNKWDDPFNGCTMYRTLLCHLLTLTHECKLPILRSSTKTETAAIVSAIQWWHEKESHGSHQGLWLGGTASLVTPTLKRKVISLFPGVGWKRAPTIAKHFKTVREMANADANKYKEVEGIGETISRQIVEAWTKEE